MNYFLKKERKKSVQPTLPALSENLFQIAI